MKRHVASTLLVLTTLGVINAHVDVEEQDGRYFGVWQGSQHDVIGWLEDRSNQLWRNCSSVQKLARDSPRAEQVLALIREYSPPDSRQAELISLQQQGNWWVAELNFAKLNPAVVLLRQDGDQLLLPERAVWSGSTAPWRPGPRIRAHLKAVQPVSESLPEPLLACYDPVSPGLR